MPVTARLLQRLHEMLGDDATNDLLSWWDEAATVNRSAVREVADLYFERFRAEMDGRLETFEARFQARLDKGLTEVRAEFKTQIADQRADLIKWMFIFWIGTIVPLAGLLVALTKL
jgi:hypothetical protein